MKLIFLYKLDIFTCLYIDESLGHYIHVYELFCTDTHGRSFSVLLETKIYLVGNSLTITKNLLPEKKMQKNKHQNDNEKTEAVVYSSLCSSEPLSCFWCKGRNIDISGYHFFQNILHILLTYRD